MSKGMLTQNSRTFTAKAPEMAAKAKWHLIDAQDLVLGRLAVEIADLIRGKHKPEFTPHVNCGDKVVVVNAEKLYLSGKKRSDKVYYWHTGYPGGIKNRTAAQLLDGNHPDRVLKAAVKRMLPSGPLAREVMRNLFVYAGSEHPHAAQQPEAYDFAAMNSKNAKRH